MSAQPELFADKPKKAPTVKTADVMAALRARYAGKSEAEWCGGFYLEECGINGATGRDTRCDALYAGFTAASGRTLIGHEVKVSRSDWLNELRKIGKADWWFDNTHQWYLVTPPGIVAAEELPHGWGHMEFQGSRLVIKTKAPVRDVTPSWVALRSMLSRAETLRAESVRTARRAAEDEVQRELASLRNRVYEAERAIGGTSRVQDLVRSIVFELEQRSFQSADRDRIVAALLDVEGLEKAAEQLRRRIQQSAANLNRIAVDAKSTYGALSDLLAAMPKGLDVELPESA